MRFEEDRDDAPGRAVLGHVDCPFLLDPEARQSLSGDDQDEEPAVLQGHR